MSAPAEVTIVAHEVGAFGGMDLQLRLLIEGLLGSGTRVTLISRTNSVPRHANLRWIAIRCPARPFSLLYPWFAIVASLLVHARAKGVIHTTGAIIFNRADVTTVHHCHSAAWSMSRRLSPRLPTVPYRINAALAAWMSRMAERWCYRPAVTRSYVAVSAGLANDLLDHFPRTQGATRVIANAVPESQVAVDPGTGQTIRRGMGIDSGADVALFLGGDWERKGLPLVVEALAAAPSWHLIVVGKGDVRHYAHMAARCGVPGRVHFAGTVDAVAPYYAACDLFVLPSCYEAFSVPAHEAAAAGLPVLASRVHGVTDLVEEGKSGVMVMLDSADIAAKLNWLAGKRELRRAMGECARAQARRYTPERMVAEYLDQYAKLAPL